MTKNDRRNIHETLDCKICFDEIPSSVHDSLEGPDYIYHYFGAQCYELWRESQVHRHNNGDDRSMSLTDEKRNL